MTAALAQKDRTGQGTHISVSMLEVAMQMMAPEAAAAAGYASAPGRSKEPGISNYETSDGQLMLGAFHPAQYRKLAQMLTGLGHELPELAQVQRWSDVWAISKQTRVALAAVFTSKSAEDWVALLREADLPAERIKTLSEAIALPQMAARGFFRPNPDAQDVPLPTAAFTMSNGGAELKTAPPKHGQQTRAILGEMGLSREQIAQLYAQGIVA